MIMRLKRSRSIARFVTRIGCMLAIVTFFGGRAHTAELPLPAGEVMLSVEGAITITNDADRAVFDLEMLRSLGDARITTSTPWTDGIIEFSGVRVVDVLAAVAAAGDEVTASALNDYASTMPVALLEESGAILAFEMNGAAMPRRDKGPLWLIFPWDERPEYKMPGIKVHAVWQLNRLVVR